MVRENFECPTYATCRKKKPSKCKPDYCKAVDDCKDLKGNWRNFFNKIIYGHKRFSINKYHI